jgi:PAS domain-containing protein
MSDGRQSSGEVVTKGEHPDRLFPLPSTRYEIEVILARQLAGYLALPIVIVDPSHVVVYYNEPAEQMLGRRFDEGAAIPGSGWAEEFEFADESGAPIPNSEMPVATALRTQQVRHAEVWMRGRDGVRRHMAETAIPLIGNAGRFLGVVAIFDEIDE